MTFDFILHAPVAETSRRARVFCAFLTAFLLWIPVQKWGWFPLAWLGVAPFLWAARALSARARFRYGWAAGWLFYALTNWWIVPTVVYASPIINAPALLGAILGVFAVWFIAAVHGLQFALTGWLWDEKRWAGKLWLLPIFIAATWGIFDWLRCVGPLSHIWGALAFSQWRDTALLQILPFAGQHGLTALLVWSAASMALWWNTRRVLLLMAPIALFAALHSYGMWRLSSPAASTKPPLRVLLVSTDVPSLRKTGLAAGETPAQQAARLTEQAKGNSLVVWPETTVEISQIGREFQRLDAKDMGLNSLRRANGDILTGARHHLITGLGEQLFNSALLVTPNGHVQSAPKIRTVPMGEKAPFGEWIPFLRRFAPTPEVTPGSEPKLLDLNGVPIGSVICFESCFPNPARALAQKGARVLFIITNDEWFAGTNAPWEHATMAIIRAAENRVPVAQVANGGYTLLVDSHGRVLRNSFGAGAMPVTIPFN